jgi:hypothetical protein
VRRLDQLAPEVRYLRSDVEELEAIFARAMFVEGKTLRLGNGALITIEEFRRYEQLADSVFGRLRKIHKLALKIEEFAIDLPLADKRSQLNATGEAIGKADALIRSRDYSVDRAWRELRALVSDLEAMIGQLNSELGRGEQR